DLLSRSGESPNAMLSNLDMNGHYILNAANTTANLTSVGKGVTTTIATAGQTTVACGIYIPTINTLQVYVNGVLQQVGIDYTENSTTSVLFTNGLDAGSLVTCIVTEYTPIGSGTASTTVYNPAGTGAVATNVQDELRQRISVTSTLPSGYVTDGSVDYTTQLQQAVTNAIAAGQRLEGVPGTFKVTGTGLSWPAGFQFDMRGMIIKNSSGNVVRIAGAAFKVTNGTLYSVGGGHTVVQTASVNLSDFSGVDLRQDATGYSCWDNAGFEYVDNRWTNFNHTHALSATVPGFKLSAVAGTINDNYWGLGRVNNSGAYFWDVVATTAGFQYANWWEKITFEVCRGGGIHQKAGMNFKIDDCQNWDAGAGLITKDFYWCELSSAGNGSIGKFINCGRWAGSNAGGVYDIKLPASGGGAGITIDNCVTTGGGDPFLVDLQNNSVLCTVPSFSVFSTVNNGGRIVLSAANGGMQFAGTANGAFLSYYDEGTFTAVLRGTTAAPTTPVTISAPWTRIGRKVFVEGVFANVSLVGATGNLQITGLPFTCGVMPACGVAGLLGLGSAPAFSQLPASSTTVAILDSVTLTAIPVSAATGKYVYFSLSYTV
ncbi:hypothetical protein UFOVP905_48, partial [uncultured Caudovirales phage]